MLALYKFFKVFVCFIDDNYKSKKMKPLTLFKDYPLNIYMYQHSLSTYENRLMILNIVLT